MLNRTNVILIVLLAVQLIIGIVVYSSGGDSDEETATGGALLADFDAANVSEVRLTNSAGESLLMRDGDDGWVLPDADDFPADSFAIDDLLRKLQNLQANRLIAENPTSHNRLEVSANANQGIIELNGGDIRLYVGSSAGANATHVRLDGQDNVYLVSGLSAADTNITASNWIDTLYFQVLPDDVVGIRIENEFGVIDLVKVDETWTLTDLADGETMIPSAVDGILPTLTGIRITRPLGTSLEEDYGLEAPQATVTLTVREQVLPADDGSQSDDGTQEPPELQFEEVTYTLQVGAELDRDQFAFKASDAEYYVLVASFTANPMINAARSDYVLVTTPEPTAEPTEEITPEPSEEPTSAPTEEATPEPSAED